MKVQLYIFSLLILLSSSNLLAVNTATTLEKTKIENMATVKKKPTKKFFKNMTQRVLENKIIKKFDNKKAKEGEKSKLGLLAVIFAAAGLAIMIISGGNAYIFLIGLLLGVVSFVLGLLGVKRDEKKALSIIGIVFGGLSVLFILAIASAWSNL